MIEEIDQPTRLRTRLLVMLACLERAGISPVAVDQLHAFVFFADVMSPLWSLEPLKGSVLKRRDGPFYKEVQVALDEFVACGLVDVVSLDYELADDTSARLSASFRIILPRADHVLSVVRAMPDEADWERFLEQLAFLFAEIATDRRDEAVEVDATYQAGVDERVVDFAEWRAAGEADHSVRAARRLQAYAPKGVTLNQAEQLVLYMRLVKRKASGS